MDSARKLYIFYVTATNHTNQRGWELYPCGHLPYEAGKTREEGAGWHWFMHLNSSRKGIAHGNFRSRNVTRCPIVVEVWLRTSLPMYRTVFSSYSLTMNHGDCPYTFLHCSSRPGNSSWEHCRSCFGTPELANCDTYQDSEERFPEIHYG